MHYVIIFVMALICTFGLSIDGSDLRQDFSFHAETILPMLVAAFIIYWFYSARFSEWSSLGGPPIGFPVHPASHYTTRLRYHLFVFAYCSIGFLALVLIYFAPRNIMTLICEIPGDAIPNCSQSFQSIQPQSIEATTLGLSIAIALLGVPVLDARWRLALQRAADIPFRAVNIVEVLHHRFDLFAAKQEKVRAFITHYNDKFGAPRLFLGDLYAPRDDGFLETYPRSEYILYELASLSHETRGALRLSDFSERVGELSDRLSEVRQDIAGLHHTLHKTLGQRFSGNFAAIHSPTEREALLSQPLQGANPPQQQRDQIRQAYAWDFDGREPDEYAVTRIDNILIALEKADDAFSDSDEVLRSFMLNRLDEISRKSHAIYSDLLRIIVIMSLRNPTSPQWFLEHLGFELSRGEAEQSEVGPWLVILILLLVVILTVVYGAVDPSDMLVVSLLSFGMLAGSVFGGFLVGNLAVGDSVTAHESGPKGVFAILDHGLVFFLMPFLAALLSVIAVRQIYPDDAGIALWFTPLAGWVGSYVALITFRERTSFLGNMFEEEPDPGTGPVSELRRSKAEQTPLRPGVITMPNATKRDLSAMARDHDLMEQKGIAYHPSDRRWFLTGSVILAGLCCSAAGLPVPIYFFLTLVMGGWVVPMALIWTIWLIDREIRRRSCDPRMTGGGPTQRADSSILYDLRYLLLLRFPVLSWPLRGFLGLRNWYGRKTFDQV